MTSLEVLKTSKIIPVIAVQRASDAINIAKALMDGGIEILELTLRTKEAIAAIEMIARSLPNAVIGAGTVLNLEQLKIVQDAGARFAISPGLTPSLASGVKSVQIPLIPGVATASELMIALENGYGSVKFFPAQNAGGVAMLKAFSGPFKEVKFCPTGGIGIENMNEYLSLANVLCVGGSWLTPSDLIEKKDWGGITKIAKNSLEMVKI